MDLTNEDKPQRPDLVFRLGITGARCLRADQRDRVQQELGTILALVCSELDELRHLEQVSQFYRPAEPAQRPPAVQLLSSLARGADRLAAAMAYSLEIPVYVPMPFLQSDYEADFRGKESKCPDEVPLTPAQDLAEFRELLAQSSGKVMLDGARNDSTWPGGDLFEGQSYEAVGRYVVRHSDLLLAVWDGSASGGRGGTQEIIDYAARTGVPVLWIHAKRNEPPRWIADRLDLEAAPNVGVAASQALRRHLRRLIPAPPIPSHAHQTLLVKLATWRQKPRSAPALEYFMQARLKKRAIWNSYHWLMKAASWRRRKGRIAQPEQQPLAAPKSQAPEYWFHLYTAADRLAGDFVLRYRSTYVLVIFFASLSLIVGELAELLKHLLPQHLLGLAALPELLLLALAIAVLLFSVRQDWHLKSVEYRLLAELFRKQKTLATLGWALSVSGVEHLADSESMSWVAWLLAATQRASPFPHCEIDEKGLTVLRVEELQHLLADQVAYHKEREETSAKVAETLERLSGLAFLGLIIVTVVKVWAFANERHEVELGVGLLAGILPTISAAFLAIRSYSELQLLADQSHKMIADLMQARDRLDRLDARRPLASQTLGAEAAFVATLMLQELDGWSRIFRGKLLETP